MSSDYSENYQRTAGTQRTICTCRYSDKNAKYVVSLEISLTTFIFVKNAACRMCGIWGAMDLFDPWNAAAAASFGSEGDNVVSCIVVECLAAFTCARIDCRRSQGGHRCAESTRGPALGHSRCSR